MPLHTRVERSLDDPLLRRHLSKLPLVDLDTSIDTSLRAFKHVRQSSCCGTFLPRTATLGLSMVDSTMNLLDASLAERANEQGNNMRAQCGVSRLARRSALHIHCGQLCEADQHAANNHSMRPDRTTTPHLVHEIISEHFNAMRRYCRRPPQSWTSRYPSPASPRKYRSTMGDSNQPTRQHIQRPADARLTATCRAEQYRGKFTIIRPHHPSYHLCRAICRAPCTQW